jgi:hypothetical protein
VSSDGAADTINITKTVNPVGAGLPRYNYTGTGIPAGGVNADDLRVFGYGGNDDITLTNIFGGWVSGNVGDDKIVLNDCNNIRVTALAPSDLDGGFVPSGNDIIEFNSSPWTNADGGDGDDRFIGSGNNSFCTLKGGPGADDFAVGGVFTDSTIEGNEDNDIVTGSGDWARTGASGGTGNDRIDLRACFGDLGISGDDDNDKLYGGSGNDWISGGGGVDLMQGGAGDDYFFAVDGWRDTVDGGSHVLGDEADVDGGPNGELLIRGVEFVEYW